MICPRCKSEDCYPQRGRITFRCRRCRHDFSKTSGTIWKSPKMPEEKRNLIIELLRSGMSVNAISKQVAVQYRTVRLTAKKIGMRFIRKRTKAPLPMTEIKLLPPPLKMLPLPANFERCAPEKIPVELNHFERWANYACVEWPPSLSADACRAVDLMRGYYAASPDAVEKFRSSYTVWYLMSEDQKERAMHYTQRDHQNRSYNRRLARELALS